MTGSFGSEKFVAGGWPVQMKRRYYTDNVDLNPRVVKEANTLTDAGYEVRVVAGDMISPVPERDTRQLFSGARWS